MNLRAEHFTGPLFGSVTLAIGVGLVLAINTLAAFFAVPVEVTPQENIGVTSSENFKTLTASEKPHEKGRVLACYDTTILPVWNPLKQDDQFKQSLSEKNGLINCSDLVDIRAVDLNNDSVDEIIVRGKAPFLCSSLGNCELWVFDKQGMTLLGGSDYVEIVGLESPIQHSKTRGYSDLLLKERSSEGEMSYRTYVFNGQWYVESRCMHEPPKYSRDGAGSLELVPCAKVITNDNR